MTITALSDATQMPSPDDDQQTFDNKMAGVFRNLPLRAQQENELAANMNSAAAGGAYAIPYIYGATGTVGKQHAVAFGGASQSTAPTFHMDFVDARGRTVSGLLDDMVAGATSSVLGTLRIEKQGDQSRYITYRVTGYTSGASDKYFATAPVNFSHADPFAIGDSVMLHFQRTGDKGDKGDTANGFSNLVVLTSTQNWIAPAGITKGEVTVVDGGYGGSGTTGGSSSDMKAGGKGGSAGVSVLTLTPGGTYSATIGAGGVGASSTSPGGASSFSGPGITTLTSANAMLKTPGGNGETGGTSASNNGGGSLTAPAGSTGYGAGGLGGSGAGVGQTGQAGVVIIRY